MKIYPDVIREFEREHKITNIILLGEDGAVRNIEIMDFMEEEG